MRVSSKRSGVIILFALVFSVIGMGFLGSDASGDTGATTIAYSESGEFSLECSVNKTGVRYGDTVEVTVTLRNLSGRDWYIEFPDNLCHNLDYEKATLSDLISTTVIPGNMPWVIHPIGVYPRLRMVIEKDSVVSCTRSYVLDGRITHVALAGVEFYTDESLDNYGRYAQCTSFYIEPINIKVY